MAEWRSGERILPARVKPPSVSGRLVQPRTGRIKTFFTLACLTLAVTGPAHAAGTHAAVNNTPPSKFNEADDAPMKARIDEALEAEKDCETPS